MTNLNHEILVEQIINPTTKKINLIDIIEDMDRKVLEISRQTKPTKIAKAYAEEEEQKLLFLHIIKRCVRSAYDDVEAYEKTTHWSTLKKHYDIEVIVKEK
jgi:hypothetical protein